MPGRQDTSHGPKPWNESDEELLGQDRKQTLNYGVPVARHAINFIVDGRRSEPV